MRTHFSRRIPWGREWRASLVIAAGVLGGVLAGCGSPASDPPSGLNSRAAAVDTAKGSETRSAEVGTQKPEQVSDTRLSGTGDRSGQNDRPSAGRQAIAEKSDETMEERNAETSPDIPESIVKDLSSPDPHIRYRALDYWGTQVDEPPLTPVFEAMEDEDPAVRAKAATIVERHIDLKKEQE